MKTKYLAKTVARTWILLFFLGILSTNAPGELKPDQKNSLATCSATQLNSNCVATFPNITGENGNCFDYSFSILCGGFFQPDLTLTLCYGTICIYDNGHTQSNFCY